jgi:nucleotide-binding universal stress UspA family protein
MNTILAPVDFSDNSRNAVEYAVVLATGLKMKLLLMHNYQPSITSVIHNTISELKGKEAGEDAKKSQDELNKWLDSIKSANPNLISYSLFTEGDLIEEIDYLVEENSIDFIVMGTKGASGLKETFIGSNTANVMTAISCPLIAVPEQYEFLGIKQMLFATDYHSSDISSLRFIIKMAEPFDAQISVLHMNNDVLISDFQDELLIDLERKTKKISGYSKLNYELIEAHDDLYVTLQRYMIKKEIDLIAMSTRAEKGKRSIFTIGLVNKMLHHANVPLLIFHTTH